MTPFLCARQFQFMQEKPGHAVLRIVPADGFGEKDSSRIIVTSGASSMIGLSLQSSLSMVFRCLLEARPYMLTSGFNTRGCSELSRQTKAADESVF